jgi:hypothetical protein
MIPYQQYINYLPISSSTILIPKTRSSDLVVACGAPAQPRFYRVWLACFLLLFKDYCLHEIDMHYNYIAFIVHLYPLISLNLSIFLPSRRPESIFFSQKVMERHLSILCDSEYVDIINGYGD